MSNELLARQDRDNASIVPLKKRGAEIVLEIANSTANCRLLDPEGRSRLEETAMFSCGKKIPNLAKLDHR